MKLLYISVENKFIKLPVELIVRGSVKNIF